MNSVQIALEFNKKFLSEAAAVAAVEAWVAPIEAHYPGRIPCRFMVCPTLVYNKNTGETLIRYGVIIFNLNSDIVQLHSLALQSGFNVMA